MDITILSHDLSHNCLGRAYLLGRLLEPKHEITIVGPRSRGTVWEPVRDEFDYRGIDADGPLYSIVPKLPRLLDEVGGDVVFAVKPKIPSYGMALLKALPLRIPIVLDIDDWETGGAYERPWLSRQLMGLRGLGDVNSFWYTRCLEQLSGLAAGVTVSNRFLKRRFGGTIVWSARDTSMFDPNRFDRDTVRERLDLPVDKRLVMFIGTPLPHKGVDDLVTAVADLDRDDVVAVVVGAEESEYNQQLTNYLEEAKSIGGDSLILRGKQPFSRLPQWLAAGDIVAIPQKRTMANRGQMPAKVFDAMAMAKPIISTNIADIPEVLEGCGVIVKPDSPQEIADEIVGLLNESAKAEAMGARARQKCIENYSFKAVSPVLHELVESLDNC